MRDAHPLRDGSDGLLPAALGRADRLGTPVAGLLCSTVMGLAFVQLGGFESVATVFSVFAFTGYLSALVSLLVLRHREPGLARPFRVWGAPWTVVAVIAGYLAIFGGVVAGAPRDAAIAIGVLAAGYAVYRVYGPPQGGPCKFESSPSMIIRSVAVLGAGVMGSQIAAHFANAGVPSLLLDVTADAAAQGLKRARGAQARPVLHCPTAGSWSSTGGVRRRPAAAGEADWIIECVVEQLDVKRALLAARGCRAAAGHDRQLEHVGHSDRRAGRGAQRRLPPPLAGHALLQPAALPAAARADSDPRYRSGGAAER